MGLWLLLFRVGRPGCVLEHILQDITQMNRRGLQSGKQLRQVHDKGSIGGDVGQEQQLFHAALLHSNDAKAEAAAKAGIG